MPLLKSQGFYLDLNSFAASNRVTKERRSFKYNYNNLSENTILETILECNCDIYSCTF